MDSNDEARRHEPLINQHEEHVTCNPDSALPSTSTLLDTVLPIRGLVEQDANTLHTLSSLSIEQLSQLENTLRQVKTTKLQQLNSSSLEPREVMNQDESAGLSRRTHGQILARIIPRPTTSSSSPDTGMRQYMSVMNSGTSRNINVITNNVDFLPSIQTIGLVPWLKFQYSTRNEKKVIKIRVDIDTINDDLETIPLDFREKNCLYPSADGPEHLYNGTRRNYERECNQQGWKLAHLNPEILCGKKGLLQQAVINLRNASVEQKSRRVKRREKKSKEQKHCCGNNSSCRPPEQQMFRYHQHLGTGIGMEQTRVYPQSHLNISNLNNTSDTTTNNTQAARTISWQPVLTSIPMISSNNQTPQLNQVNTQSSSSHGDIHPLPISSSTFDDTNNNSIEFDQHSKGQVQKIRIRCDIDNVNIEEIPIEMKRANCVYPRSFIEREAEDFDGSTSPKQHQQWEPMNTRQAEESYLNEIGWKLCLINRSVLEGKRLLLQQALNAYRHNFLPVSCHPRARAEPLQLTRNTSTTLGILPTTTSSSSSSTNRLPISKQSYQMENTNDALDKSRRPSKDKKDTTEGLGNMTNLSSGDESSASSSSSSAPDGNFHSQMSLLTFHGSIRTYSLGSESGSARSRPRVRPTTTTRVIGPRTSNLSTLFPTNSSNTIRKRPISRLNPSSQNQSLGESHGHKKVRWKPSTESTSEPHSGQGFVDGSDGEEEKDPSEATSLHSDGHVSDSDSEDVIEGLDQNAIDQEEDDDGQYWMSRLQNSEYQEDHNFVSMTTEELIGALTSGYNSDIEDEDEMDEMDDYSYF